MPASSPSPPPDLSLARLADLIERYADAVVPALVAALRGLGGEPGDAPAPTAPNGPPPSPAVSASATHRWTPVGVIEDFEHIWPEVHEHYDPMTVWQTTDEHGLVRLALGRPRETLTVYGRERGWLSVWEVVNGQPREQRAVFLDTDDYATTGEGIALISGKDGRKKALFTPGEEHLLPPVYRGMRVEVHRDRCSGPYAKNRLGVVATDQDTEIMLEHGLAHLRLRS